MAFPSRATWRVPWDCHVPFCLRNSTAMQAAGSAIMARDCTIVLQLKCKNRCQMLGLTDQRVCEVVYLYKGASPAALKAEAFRIA